MSKHPSQERGCDGKINLGKDYTRNANRLSRKHGKSYGVYHCPYCMGYHVTTKLDPLNASKYAPLLYVSSHE